MWHVHFIGAPDKINKALDAFDAGLTGAEKNAFALAKLSIQKLLILNFSNEQSVVPTPVVELRARGEMVLNAAGQSLTSILELSIEQVGKVLA